ncbi:DUF29 domain-containing protein [Duganella callida]|uniref:DUF29 domain-containing protein n=1 Tax=Duganella callida TaxID=2561932 RepID=A0A4Y9S5R4_9BURK|nr:DUF29 domain-containing protein [Duganella callida]TFW15803.1 DUF29 domain-containing protein [Duganella callida]
MSNLYDEDVAAWAEQQVALLRSRQWALLDIDHIVEEIEDMNISHRHELANRMSILIAHLLKWKYQEDRRGASWHNTISTQRNRIARLLKKMPSLKHLLNDFEWNQDVWEDAVEIAGREANLADLPREREWTLEQVLSDDYFPT